MRHLLTILAALLLCSAPLHAQTLKSLMYNSTNGNVVANTGTNVLTFSNTVQIPTLTNVGGGIFMGDMNYVNSGISGYGREINFEEAIISGGDWIIYGSLSWNNTTNAATTRANLGFSTNLNTLWTATNASNARSAVGLGETNFASFAGVNISATNGASVFDSNATFSVPVRINTTNGIQFWGVNSNAARIATRANLFPDVTAFTNTSNVSVMRALAGSTNTSEPYSGEITIRDFNDDSHIVSISNGIILNWSTP